MNSDQKWGFIGLAGGLILLIVPPFYYTKQFGMERQWHFFLDSRFTEETLVYPKKMWEEMETKLQETRSTDWETRLDVRGKFEQKYESQRTRERERVDGREGKVDVFFLLLELTILCLSLYTVRYVQQTTNLFSFRTTKKIIPSTRRPSVSNGQNVSIKPITK